MDIGKEWKGGETQMQASLQCAIGEWLTANADKLPWQLYQGSRYVMIEKTSPGESAPIWEHKLQIDTIALDGARAIMKLLRDAAEG